MRRHLGTIEDDLWNSYYGQFSVPMPEKTKTPNSNTQISGPRSNYYVHLSEFKSISNSAIRFIQYDQLYILISLCYFEKCISTKSGGAILFTGNSSFVQHRCCSTECQVDSTTGQNGHHSYVELKSGTSHLNYIIEGCIHSCGNDKAMWTAYLSYGLQKVISCNITSNSAKWNSGLGWEFATRVGQCNYSTFYQNYASYGRCVASNWVSPSQYLLFNCNVLNNSQKQNLGIISCRSQMKVDSCCFNENNANKKGYLFENSGQYSFEVVYCLVDVYSSVDTNIITKNIMQFSRSFKLKHLSSYKCEAQVTGYNNDVFFVNFCDFKLHCTIPLLNFELVKLSTLSAQFSLSKRFY